MTRPAPGAGTTDTPTAGAAATGILPGVGGAPTTTTKSRRSPSIISVSVARPPEPVDMPIDAMRLPLAIVMVGVETCTTVGSLLVTVTVLGAVAGVCNMTSPSVTVVPSGANA